MYDAPLRGQLAANNSPSRLLAGELKVRHKTVTRAWKAYGIKPWKGVIT
jgi:hypothetical protein